MLGENFRRQPKKRLSRKRKSKRSVSVSATIFLILMALLLTGCAGSIPRPVTPLTAPVDEIQAERPGSVIDLPIPVRAEVEGQPHACFDSDAFAMLDARDEILLEHRGMAERNADVIRQCRNGLEVMQGEADDQHRQALAFREALVDERRQRWGERLLWSAFAAILAFN